MITAHIFLVSKGILTAKDGHITSAETALRVNRIELISVLKRSLKLIQKEISFPD